VSISIKMIAKSTQIKPVSDVFFKDEGAAPKLALRLMDIFGGGGAASREG
jgi:hypothetical protein